MEIDFFIDNQAAIKALEQVSSNNLLVHETKLKLNDICKFNQVTLNWIPGHQGHRGNEIADRLAKLGGKGEFVGPLPVIPAPNVGVVGEIREWATKEHNKTWKMYKQCNKAKLFFNQLRPPESVKILNMKRCEINLITQIVTGHGDIGHHNFIVGREDNDLCKCEQEAETYSYIHLLTCCPVYLNQRRNTLKHYLHNS